MEASMRCMRAAVRTTTRRGRIIVYSHGSKYIIFIKFNVKTARLIAYHVFVTIVKYTLCTGQLKIREIRFFSATILLRGCALARRVRYVPGSSLPSGGPCAPPITLSRISRWLLSYSRQPKPCVRIDHVNQFFPKQALASVVWDF